MAVRVPGNGGSSRETPGALSEINVTPLVDVMLVLLIIFMVTAPLLQSGIQVDLPKADGSILNAAPGQAYLVINRNQEIFLDNEKIVLAVLKTRLEALATTRPNVALYVQADAAVPYGYVAQILADIRKSKIEKVGLVTEPGEEKGKR